MFNLEKIEKIFFQDIIEEAKQGEVLIPDENGKDCLVFNIGFHACIEGRLNSGSFGDSKPVLMIQNRKQLLPLLKQYIDEVDKQKNYFSKLKEEDRIKAYLSLVWVNAIYEDFANPTMYLKKRIDFLQDKLFDFEIKTYASNIDFFNFINDKNKKAINIVNGSDLVVEVSSQDIRMETPYLFCGHFTKKIDGQLEYYELPSISYGISNGECYIYSILDKNTKKDSEYQKSINRVLYGLNKGVLENETKEFQQYMANRREFSEQLDEYSEVISEDIPENISQVSPAAIVALTIFLDILHQYGIDKIKLVSLLPLRYNGKEETFQKKYAYQLKQKNLDKTELEKILLEYKKEQLRIQKNLSEKLIRNFRRLEYHFPNCFISSYPLELDEYLHMRFSEFKLSNNTILNDILDSKNKRFMK